MNILWLVALASQILHGAKSHENYQAQEVVADRQAKIESRSSSQSQNFSSPYQQSFKETKEKTFIRRKRLRPPSPTEILYERQLTSFENNAPSMEFTDDTLADHLDISSQAEGQGVENYATTVVDNAYVDTSNTQKPLTLDDDQDLADQVGRYLKTKTGKSSKVQLCELLLGLCPRIRELLDKDKGKHDQYIPPCETNYSGDSLEEPSTTTTTTTTMLPIHTRCNASYSRPTTTPASTFNSKEENTEAYTMKPIITFKHVEKIGKNRIAPLKNERVSTTSGIPPVTSTSAPGTITTVTEQIITKATAAVTATATEEATAVTATMLAEALTTEASAVTMTTTMAAEAFSETTAFVTTKSHNNGYLATLVPAEQTTDNLQINFNHNGEKSNLRLPVKIGTYEGIIEVNNKKLNIGDTYGEQHYSKEQDSTSQSEDFKLTQITIPSANRTDKYFTPEKTRNSLPSLIPGESDKNSQSIITTYNINSTYANYGRNNAAPTAYTHHLWTTTEKPVLATTVNIEKTGTYRHRETSSKSKMAGGEPDLAGYNWKPTTESKSDVTSSNGFTYVDWPPNSRSKVVDLRPIPITSEILPATTEIPLSTTNENTPYVYKVVEETYGTWRAPVQSSNFEPTAPSHWTGQSETRTLFPQFIMTTATPSTHNLKNNLTPDEAKLTPSQSDKSTNIVPSSYSYESESYNGNEETTTAMQQTTVLSAITATTTTAVVDKNKSDYESSSWILTTAHFNKPKTTTASTIVESKSDMAKKTSSIMSLVNVNREKGPTTVVEEVPLENAKHESWPPFTQNENKKKIKNSETNNIYTTWPQLLSNKASRKETIENPESYTATTTSSSTQKYSSEISNTGVNAKTETESESSEKVNYVTSETFTQRPSKTGYIDNPQSNQSTSFPMLHRYIQSSEEQVVEHDRKSTIPVLPKETIYYEALETTLSPYASDQIKTININGGITQEKIPAVDSNIHNDNQIASFTSRLNNVNTAAKMQPTTTQEVPKVDTLTEVPPSEQATVQNSFPVNGEELVKVVKVESTTTKSFRDEKWSSEHDNGRHHAATPIMIINNNKFISVAPSHIKNEETYEHLALAKQEEPDNDKTSAGVTKTLKETWVEKASEYSSETWSETPTPIHMSQAEARALETATEFSSKIPVQVQAAAQPDDTTHANIQASEEQVRGAKEFERNGLLLTGAPPRQAVTVANDLITDLSGAEQPITENPVKNKGMVGNCKYKKNGTGEITCVIENEELLHEVSPSNFSTETPADFVKEPYKTAPVERSETSEATAQLSKQISTRKPYRHKENTVSYDIIDSSVADGVGHRKGYTTESEEVAASPHYPREKIIIVPETIYEVYPARIPIEIPCNTTTAKPAAKKTRIITTIKRPVKQPAVHVTPQMIKTPKKPTNPNVLHSKFKIIESEQAEQLRLPNVPTTYQKVIAYQLHSQQQPLIYRPAYQQSNIIYPMSYQTQPRAVQPQQAGCCGGSWLSSTGAVCTPIVFSPCPATSGVPVLREPSPPSVTVPFQGVPQLQLPIAQPVLANESNGCGAGCQTMCQPCTQRCCCCSSMFSSACSRLKRSLTARRRRICP